MHIHMHTTMAEMLRLWFKKLLKMC